MSRKSFDEIVKTGLVTFLLCMLLFANSRLHISDNFIGSTLTEIAAVFHNSETQWMVFLCLWMYLLTFLFLPFYANGNNFKRLIWFLSEKVGPRLAGCPTFWLTSALFFSAVLYVINYSPSTPALTFLAGAVVGQSAIVWVSPNSKRFCSSLFYFPILFVILFSLSSGWNIYTAYNHDYQNYARWSGLWDNPNIFGLLMAAGAVQASGVLVLEGLGKKRSGISRLAFGRFVIVCLCFVGIGLMVFGLLHSYSRGAWLGASCGGAYLILSWIARLGSWGDLLSSRVSRLQRSLLPLVLIVVSVVMLGFWHFRQTDWHLVHRAFSTVNTADFSWRNRISAWDGALQTTAEHPWFGTGWHQPEALYEHYYLPAKLNESAAIEMNDYLVLGATLGIPALFCFGMYLWLMIVGGKKTGSGPKRQKAGTGDGEGEKLDQSFLTPATTVLNDSFLSATCRAGAIVLLVGFWFDGGLFKLPTASTFWILLELGNVCDRELQDNLTAKSAENSKINV